MSQFEPCTLKRHEEGDSVAFQAKLTGAGCNDMCNMSELTKDSILELLKDRFRKEIVYTYVGDIVVSVNPFKNVGAVGKAIRNRYKKGGAQNAQLLMPHCYHLVDSTYAQMMTEQKSQSILISGESGAGKTEAMKICLTYIGEISAPKGGGKAVKGEIKEADPTAARLMQTNPVMEAIGNAKTVRNDNSSRFGKHFDIQFDDKGTPKRRYADTLPSRPPAQHVHAWVIPQGKGGAALPLWWRYLCRCARPPRSSERREARGRRIGGDESHLASSTSSWGEMSLPRVILMFACGGKAEPIQRALRAVARCAAPDCACGLCSRPPCCSAPSPPLRHFLPLPRKKTGRDSRQLSSLRCSSLCIPLLLSPPSPLRRHFGCLHLHLPAREAAHHRAHARRARLPHLLHGVQVRFVDSGRGKHQGVDDV